MHTGAVEKSSRSYRQKSNGSPVHHIGVADTLPNRRYASMANADRGQTILGFTGIGSTSSGNGCRKQPLRTTPCRVPPMTTQELCDGYGQFCEIGDKMGINLNNWGKVAINWVKDALVQRSSISPLLTYYPNCVASALAPELHANTHPGADARQA